MTAKYLVRLDDACPTMHRAHWAAIEEGLDRLGIRPIVAVVPDNRDPELMVSPPDPAFWDRVRAWQSKGWSIAMHGVHHAYHPVDKKRLIIPLHNRSEFAGLSYGAQADLIARSWSIFDQNGVHPTVWIAPGHAFDTTTVDALGATTPIRIISDGLSIHHFCERGFKWIPQQLWNPEPRRSGLWTICLHPNTMDERQIGQVAKQLAEPFYRERTVALSDLELPERRKSLADLLYPRYFFGRRRAIEAMLPHYHRLKRLRERLRT